MEKNYRELLQTFAINSILNGNYDYLHGGLGIVKYYCDDAEFVNRALEALEQTAEKYPQLTIRVSGYAVNFIKLSREHQLEVISRSFHERM